LRTGFWSGNPKEGDHLGHTGIDGSVKLRLIFRKWFMGAWSGLIWLSIGKGGGVF